ncbi:shikimate kinase AroK [Marinobacteraceae bacterium S3BR75-40.1]
MTTPERIVLIGPMGAGKSTIGRLLARELGYTFLDTDKVIEERCGANIPWIFDVEGEAGFRRRESQIIEELVQEPGLVLATGGGAVLDPENRKMLSSGSLVIYLQTSVEQQYERTRRDRNRPLLQKPDPKGVLKQLFDERNPIYESIADWVVRTDRKSPRLVVRQLINRLFPKTARHRRQAQAGQ